MKQTTQTTINKDGIMQENITKQEAEALYQKKTDALQLTDQIPLVDGTPSAGASSMAAHGDHVHPVPAEIPKNLYNLGAFDTYVSGSYRTGTVTRKTGRIDKYTKINILWQGNNGKNRQCYVIGPYNVTLNDLRANVRVTGGYWGEPPSDNVIVGTDSTNIMVSPATGDTLEQCFEKGLVIEYLLPSEYQYTEQVIENQPIRPANQEEELYWHDEWEKGLNLIDLRTVQSVSKYGVTFTVNSNSIVISGTNTLTNEAVTLYLFNDINKVKGKVITLSGKISDDIFLEGNYVDSSGSTHYFNQRGVDDGSTPVYIPEDARSMRIYCGVREGATANNVTIYPMLNFGSHPYPYEPYNGGIIHEADLTPVKIADSATATSGTLTEEQLAILQNTDRSILFNNELYVPADREHAAGYLVYTHLGYESEKFFTKAITITISTRGWVLTSSEVGGGGGDEYSGVEVTFSSYASSLNGYITDEQFNNLSPYNSKYILYVDEFNPETKYIFRYQGEDKSNLYYSLSGVFGNGFIAAETKIIGIGKTSSINGHSWNLYVNRRATNYYIYKLILTYKRTGSNVYSFSSNSLWTIPYLWNDTTYYSSLANYLYNAGYNSTTKALPIADNRGLYASSSNSLSCVDYSSDGSYSSTQLNESNVTLLSLTRL